MNKRAVAIIRKGRVIAIYSSTGNAGRCMGYSDATIRNYIANGTQKGGLSFRFADEAETKLIRRLGGLPVSKDNDEVVEAPKPTVKESNYTTISYETIAGKVCITPCPHRIDDKPKVGSSQCAECPFFHGRNREKQTVRCSAASDRTWKRTREKLNLKEEEL
jgi:hypothetical protein